VASTLCRERVSGVLIFSRKGERSNSNVLAITRLPAYHRPAIVYVRLSTVALHQQCFTIYSHELFYELLHVPT